MPYHISPRLACSTAQVPIPFETGRRQITTPAVSSSGSHVAVELDVISQWASPWSVSVGNRAYFEADQQPDTEINILSSGGGGMDIRRIISLCNRQAISARME